MIEFIIGMLFGILVTAIQVILILKSASNIKKIVSYDNYNASWRNIEQYKYNSATG